MTSLPRCPHKLSAFSTVRVEPILAVLHIPPCYQLAGLKIDAVKATLFGLGIGWNIHYVAPPLLCSLKWNKANFILLTGNNTKALNNMRFNPLVYLFGAKLSG